MRKILITVCVVISILVILESIFVSPIALLLLIECWFAYDCAKRW
mgnify:CR=1 FL=1|jgi:hypothetical protein